MKKRIHHFVMRQAHALKKDKGITMSAALKIAWAEKRSLPTEQVYVLTFEKKDGSITTRRAVDLKPGKGTSLAFVSASDDYQIRALRSESLISVKMEEPTQSEFRFYLDLLDEVQQNDVRTSEEYSLAVNAVAARLAA